MKAFIAGAITFIALAFVAVAFVFPWEFTTAKSLFENGDIGTIIGLLAIFLTAGFVFTVAFTIALVVAAAVEVR